MGGRHDDGVMSIACSYICPLVDVFIFSHLSLIEHLVNEQKHYERKVSHS
jgi:hypothetical protein